MGAFGFLDRRIHLFVEGQPSASENLLQYTVVDDMTLPVGLTGSVIYQRVQTNTIVVYSLFKNDASIGSITFNGPSPEDIVVEFAGSVAFTPGDVLSMIGPPVPDTAQTDISFTLVATLVL